MKTLALFGIAQFVLFGALAASPSSKTELNGTGCRKGTVTETGTEMRTENAPEARFQLAAFVIDPKGRSIDRKNCSIAVPLGARPGIRVVSAKLQIHGTYSVPPGSQAKVHLEVFSAGARGVPIDQELKGTDTPTPLTMAREIPLNTGCGKTALLRLNSSGVAQKSARIQIERIELAFRTEPCSADSE